MGKLRQNRGLVLKALREPESWAALEAVPPKELIGPLYACLLEPEPLMRWRAISALGLVVAKLADQGLELARPVMRQLMWRLNEESGNMAWGAPETFGEILAQHGGLAQEFHRVLASYIHERDCQTGDNYLEHGPLRQGAYWGLARLAQVRPKLALPAWKDLLLALKSAEPAIRGFSAWALAGILPLGGPAASQIRNGLTTLLEDQSGLELYRDGALDQVTVGALAREALNRDPAKGGSHERT